MFDDLDNDSGYNPQSHGGSSGSSQSSQQNGQSQGGHSQSGGQNRYNGGGYQSGGNYNGGGRKEDVLQDAYIPVAFYVEKDFSDDVKNTFYSLASRMIAKKMTVRINGDDKAFIDRLRSLSEEKVEVYLPWRGFNQIESKKTYNGVTCKDVASRHFLGWEKIPDSVKAILASQVRLIFGDKNNSIAMCLITWSKDGAGKPSEVTKDTGRSGFAIKMAGSFGFPVLNLQRQHAVAVLEKTFSL